MDSDTLDLMYLSATTLFTSAAAVTDWSGWRIPNALTVSAFAVGLVTRVALGGWDALLVGLGGFAFGFGVLLVLWLLGGTGAGDVKLMGAVGAWLGFRKTFVLFIGSALLLTLMMVIAAIIRTITKAPSSSESAGVLKTITGKERHHKRLTPYAVPVATMAWLLLAIQVSKVMHPALFVR